MRSAPARESAPPQSDIPFDASIVPAAKAGAAPAESRARRWIVSWAKSAAATLGAMYVVGWFMLTFGVAVVNSLGFAAPKFTNTARRLVVSDAARPFGLAADPSITPERAGEAYLAVVGPNPRPSVSFPQKGVAERLVVPWRGKRLDASLFKGIKHPSYAGPSNLALTAAAVRSFSPTEKAILKEYATAPLWREFDLFARAPAADIIGARFVLPFRSTALSYEMPLIRFTETRDVANASIARAAWHLSEGRRDSAVFALQSTIAFGRALSDNSTAVVEQLLGTIITNIGRDGLVQLYTTIGDPRAAAITAAAVKAEVAPLPPGTAEFGGSDLSQTRAAALKLATSPTTTRGLRVEALNLLVYSSCGSVRELLTGPDASVRAAFDQARRDLARFPSELAYLDLMAQSLERTGQRISPEGDLTPPRVLALAGRAYFNPRLVACTMATPLGGSFWNLVR